MKEEHYIFTCDLCNEKATNDKNMRPPLWVTIEFNHSDTGRLLGEKHVCDECCLQIKALHERG